MVRFNIPQRLSSKLKLRLLNASEIIIMQACVSLLAASVSLTVDARSFNGEDTFNPAANNPQMLFIKRRVFSSGVYIYLHTHPHSETYFNTDVLMLYILKMSVS